jgi:hypothetical protein
MFQCLVCDAINKRPVKPSTGRIGCNGDVPCGFVTGRWRELEEREYVSSNWYSSQWASPEDREQREKQNRAADIYRDQIIQAQRKRNRVVFTLEGLFATVVAASLTYQFSSKGEILAIGTGWTFLIALVVVWLAAAAGTTWLGLRA